MDEVFEQENRFYVNPDVSSAEQDEFIQRFRAAQEAGQARINQETYNLGTPVTSNLGGLTGAQGLWDTQYRPPQVQAAIDNLQQVRLQQALNTAMTNEQNVMAERLNQAKRAYNRAQALKSANDGNGGNGGGGDDDGDVEQEKIPEGTPVGTTTGGLTGTSTVAGPSSVLWDDQGTPSWNVFVEGEDGYLGYGASNTGTRNKTYTVSPGFWETISNLIKGAGGSNLSPVSNLNRFK